MGKTSIEWTDASWNPIVGCTEVSPGCANCYAARLSASRLSHVPAYKGLATIQTDNPRGGGHQQHTRWTGHVRFLEERLEEPLHWRTPRRIFVCDMGDLFHESVHGDWIDQIIHIMDQCPQHTFQILTKRAQRMHDLLRHYPMAAKKNVWIGTSVENQHFANERIPLLLQTLAAVRFISAEPLLGHVDLWPMGYASGWLTPMKRNRANDGLDWVICGGESGPHARAMNSDWARNLRDQCQVAGVPFFFKQWGEWRPLDQMDHATHCEATKSGAAFAMIDGRHVSHFKLGKKTAGRLLDGREWNEFPLAAS